MRQALFKRGVIFFLVVAFSLFLFCAFASQVFAGSAVLTWNANIEADLAGYKIHYDTASRQGNCPAGYPNHIDAGKVTSYTVSNLPEGHVYYFQLTAYDASGNESTCSNSAGTVPQKIMYYKGDIDKNRSVNIFDYNLFIPEFGKTNCGNQADLDGNCSVNIFDYNIFVPDFGKSF